MLPNVKYDSPFAVFACGDRLADMVQVRKLCDSRVVGMYIFQYYNTDKVNKILTVPGK